MILFFSCQYELVCAIGLRILQVVEVRINLSLVFEDHVGAPQSSLGAPPPSLFWKSMISKLLT